MPLDALAHEARWVAWRNELRGGKPTKVPYAPNGKMAKADDPATWGTRAEAEARAKKLINGHGGGIGIELGDLGGDIHLAGFDLDSCLGEVGVAASWAEAILSTVLSYAEVSPSGRGLKVFFYRELRRSAVSRPHRRSAWAMGSSSQRAWRGCPGSRPCGRSLLPQPIFHRHRQ
jgi:putative DNA primase/helicase